MAVAWMGCINVGTFFCCMALGVWCSLKFFHPSKKNFSNKFWFLVIIIEVISSAVIVYAAILNTNTNSPTLWEAIGLLAMFSLGFLHGLISSYFNVWRAPISKVHQN